MSGDVLGPDPGVDDEGDCPVGRMTVGPGAEDPGSDPGPRGELEPGQAVSANRQAAHPPMTRLVPARVVMVTGPYQRTGT
jgi:hypothetical protein